MPVCVDVDVRYEQVFADVLPERPKAASQHSQSTTESSPQPKVAESNTSTTGNTKVVVLTTSDNSSTKIETDQRRCRDLFNAKKVPFEEVKQHRLLI